MIGVFTVPDWLAGVAFTVTWREILIAMVLAAALYVLELMILARRRDRPAGVSLAEVRQMRAELLALRQRLDHLEDSVSGPPPEEGVPQAQAAYDYAVQFARQGMIAPEIAARCGISHDEAALIVAMHHVSPEGGA